jgi:hypothetical protein
VSVLHVLLGFFACAITCLAAGLLSLRALRIEANKLETVCLGYAIGSALVSTLTLAMGFLWIARKGSFMVLAGVAIVVCCGLVPWFRSLKLTPLDSVPVFFRFLFAVTWVVYGALYFRHALAPERSPDAAAYHLGLVHLWNHAHGLPRIVDMYAALPQGTEMLFLFAFAIGRHSAAALMHFSFLMLLPAMMIAYGIRFRFSRGAAAFAAIAVFVTPLVGWDGSVAYNDVALATILFAVVYLLQIWRQRRDAGSLAAAGVLAGYCCAIKYTGIFALLLVVATVIWESRRWLRASRPAIVAALGAMTLAPSPYLVRNWIWFQNPIAFFGNAIFRNPYFHVSFETSYIEGQVHLNGVRWIDLPRELTLGGPKLPDNLGPIYLLAPVALAGLFWPQSRFLLLAALVAGCAYGGNKSARFLIPVLPLVMMAVAWVLSRLARAAPVLASIAMAQVVLSWPAVTEQTHFPRTARPNFEESTWAAALRRQPEEQYLASLDEYVLARQIESHIPEGERVLSLPEAAMQSYTTRVLVDSFHSADAEKAADLFYAHETSATDARWRWAAVFPETRALQVLIEQNAKSPAMWSIAEIRFSRAGKTLSASADWDSWPNPWDIGLAHDGLEATRWRSWEPLRPGMRVTARMHQAYSIDRLEVLSGNGPWETQLNVRILADNGVWVNPVSAEWLADPPADLRKGATQAIKQQGFRYVVFSRFSWHEQAFRANPALWGMHEVLSTANSTLYEIE